MGRKAGTGDALDAPVMEAETGAVAGAAVGAAADVAADADVGVVVDVAADVAADVDAGVAVGGILEQEDRALAHDGDDRIRDAVARAQREKASVELKNAQ